MTLVESVHNNCDARTSLLSELFVELRVHSVLEQQVFYPAVASVLSKDTERDAEKELYTILAMMLELEREPGDSERFEQDLAAIADRFAHHVHEQERCVFDEVQAHFSAPELSSLGSRLQRRKTDVHQSVRAGMRGYVQTLCA
jgi:hypothetical protein